MVTGPIPPVGGPPPTPGRSPEDVQRELHRALTSFITTFRQPRPNPSDMASVITTLNNSAQEALKTRGS